MDAQALNGMAVVAVAEGTKLGHIEELLFDPQGLGVAAIRVRGENGRLLIPFVRLGSIGDDAVMVESEAVAQVVEKGQSPDGLIGLGKLTGLKVVDMAGTLLGTVARIAIDPADGRLLALEAEQGGVLGLGGTTNVIAAEAVQGIGPEVLTVTEARPQRAPQSESDE